MKITVDAHECGLLFRNGRFVRRLEPGRHRIMRLFIQERVEKVDLRVRTLVLTGQEMLTQDEVTLRLTALARFQVVDPVAAVLTVEDYVAQTYADVQLALRDAVGGLALDALLAEKGRLGEVVRAAVAARAITGGVEVLEVGVRDLMLPGEMKTILNQVIEARKRAEAAQVLRREDVASTRSLANTAELLARNPVLMRLKELEVLERIAGRGATVVVSPETVGLAVGSKA